jgi:hypothetical protein
MAESPQVAEFFGQVEHWLSLTRQAGANPGYRPGDLEFLPADLPGWIEMVPCPAAHLEAMIAAGAAVREHAEVALGTFASTCTGDEHRADLDRLRQMAAEWASVHRARGSVLIGRRRLRPGQKFTFEVSAEENGRFVREIITGPFQPAPVELRSAAQPLSRSAGRTGRRR